MLRTTRFSFDHLRAASLATVVLAAAGVPAPAQEVTRGPYLQLATAESVTVVWSTSVPTDSRVVYGPTPDALHATVEDGLLTIDHAVTLTGLGSDLLYHYAVGTTAQLLAGGDGEHAFRTSPRHGTANPTRVWVLGDSGQGGGAAVQVRDAYYQYVGAQPTDLILMLGDNAYPSGTQEQYQTKLFDFYPEKLRTSPLWTAIGNHDSFDATSGSWPYFDIFLLPENGEAGGAPSGSEAYYSFDHANIHFVVLDSTTYPGGGLAASPMLPWLETDLAATTQRWLVTIFHHPPYTKAGHDSDDPSDSNGRLVDMRTLVAPILEDHGVDVVLTGHSHSYERSYLIDGHYGDSSTWVETMAVDSGDGAEDSDGAYQALGAGTVYTVAGSSSITSGGAFDHPAMFAGENTLGSVVLEVGGNRLDAVFLDNTGTVQDRYTLLKGGCDEDGVCEADEDCYVCPEDCGSVSGASCGNDVCEIVAGEDCVSCPVDCRGKQNGKPSKRYCCGDGDGENPVPLNDARCTTNEFWITDQPVTPACCGDAVCAGAETPASCGLDCFSACGDDVCDGGESSCDCAVDCGAPPASEAGPTCSDGQDNDCDGATDGDDSDCPSCAPLGASCSDASECCSNKCKGKPGATTCK